MSCDLACAHIVLQAISDLQAFKTKNGFWAAFVVQTDFQKHAKKSFTAVDIDTNMAMVRELDGAVKKLSSEITNLNKVDAARSNN